MDFVCKRRTKSEPLGNTVMHIFMKHQTRALISASSTLRKLIRNSLLDENVIFIKAESVDSTEELIKTVWLLSI